MAAKRMALFLLPLLFYGTAANGDWRKYCLNIVRFFTGVEKQTTLDAMTENVSVNNQFEVGQKWALKLREVIGRRGDKIAERFLAIPDTVLARNFLGHAFQNAVQHGAQSVEQQYFESVPVTATATLIGKALVLQISNPQIKPFPKSLRKRFYSGSSISIPEGERVGYQGGGMAHQFLVMDLGLLPRHSYVEWEPDGQQVRFTLSIFLGE